MTNRNRDRPGIHTSVALCFALALLLVGCGANDSGTVENPHDEDPVNVAPQGAADGGGSSGTDASTSEGGKIGVPLAPSADAVSTMEAGPMTVVQFIVPLDDRQATISFYDEWTGSQAAEYQRTESPSGGVSWQNAPAAGDDKHIIAVLSPLEGDDFVTVTLTVGPAE